MTYLEKQIFRQSWWGDAYERRAADFMNSPEPMRLEIKAEMTSDVMHALAARAKYYEKAIESGTLLDEKSKAEWQHMADEYWALVRQFSK